MKSRRFDTRVPVAFAAAAVLIHGACNTRPADRGVSYERLLAAEADSGNWLTYSGSYSGRRFTRLAQIDRSNVRSLVRTWSHPLDVSHAVETTPLVVNGVMYLTRPPSDVLAIDVRSGQTLWEFEWPVPDGITVCCGFVNRGVAMLNETLYLGTIDAHLVALDAHTGQMKWSTRVADHTLEFSITGAPLVVKDMVLTGVGITQRLYRPDRQIDTRAYLDAYDAETGELRWRFYSIPGPGEPGNETWAGDSWLQGGATTWMTGTFDPTLNLIYWGIGNPIPTLFGELREGDNLYSASVVALDADSGLIRWHFQYTPHDLHDWDATQIPILADMRFDGQDRRLLLSANRNGFYYVLDRTTGEFLQARQFARQTWAAGIDETGRSACREQLRVMRGSSSLPPCPAPPTGGPPRTVPTPSYST